MKSWTLNALILVAGLALGGAIYAARHNAHASAPAQHTAATLSPEVLAKVKSSQAAIPDVPTGQDRKPHAPPASGEVRTLTIKELGNFPFDPEKGGNIPADVKALNGMKVRLNGFMLPLSQADQVTDFALVPSLFACCFGQPPGVEHVVTVRIPKDKATNMVIDEIQVEGTLRVQEKREDNYSFSLFELDATALHLAQ